MKYTINDLDFRDLTDEELKQFKEEGFIGEEGGDGYAQRTVAYYDKEYAIPGRKGDCCEYFEVEMEQLIRGCVYNTFKKRVFLGTKDGASIAYIVKPTLCSMGLSDNIRVFDDLEEAIDFYERIKKFGENLKAYKG